MTPARGRFAEAAGELCDVDGVSICIDCGLVFEPRAKHGARRCELCNGSATATPLWQRVDHADGRGWSLGTIFGAMHFRCCAGCCLDFLAGKVTTLYCGTACRKAASRGARREPPLWAKDDEYRAAVRAAIEADVADRVAHVQAAAAASGGPRVTVDELIAEVRAQRAR